MVANIELEKKANSFKLHSYDGPSSSIKKSVENCPYVWHDDPNQIKIAMSSDEPRPAKIYFISYSHGKGTDAHSYQNLSCWLQ